MTAVDPAVEAQLEATREARLESYLEFLRIPSISALPEHAGDMRRAAEWIAAELSRIGFEHAEVCATPWHPIVYADWLHAEGAPTVIVYCHYDVQPVDPIELWDTAPFEPFVRDGRMIGRGAADDKGQLHMHLRAAEALFATRGRLPLNLRIVFEGEEESTSASMPGWLEANRDRLGADVVVISDTGFFEGNIPALTESLRGILYTQIDVSGPPADLHSGSYGGNVENPANALARIIAELKGRDGVIRVPGFYDDVIPVDAAARGRLAALPFDEAAYLDRVGVPALAGESDYTVLEREGVRPTLDVNGIWGGFQGDGSKTIIPARAHAKVSMRLVANQDPLKLFERFRDFVLQVAPPGIRVEVTRLGAGRPSATPVDHPVVRAAARALEATFGREPVFRRNGGSIPVAEMFDQQLGLTVVLMGFTNPDDHAHSPNESMVMANYETGIRTICLLWDMLGEHGLEGAASA
ncbi:MAG TPA: dipeptidase [Candidatus Limnocylindrales bacterium]|nr:dipeptidase [Candidatus Limnocylindrales bacterium]